MVATKPVRLCSVGMPNELLRKLLLIGKMQSHCNVCNRLKCNRILLPENLCIFLVMWSKTRYCMKNTSRVEATTYNFYCRKSSTKLISQLCTSSSKFISKISRILLAEAQKYFLFEKQTEITFLQTEITTVTFLTTKKCCASAAVWSDLVDHWLCQNYPRSSLDSKVAFYLFYLYAYYLFLDSDLMISVARFAIDIIS